MYSFGFNITTSIGDLPILILVKNRLGCGRIVIKETWCRLDIDKQEDLIKIIIPLVDSLEYYRKDGKGLLSHKAQYYAIWKEGIIRHSNNEFSKPINLQVLSTQNKKIIRDNNKEALKIQSLKNYIIKAYNLHDEGKKRKIPLNEFLKLHGFD